MKYLLPLILFCTLNAQVYVPIHHEPPTDTTCVDTMEIVQNWKAALLWGVVWGTIIYAVSEYQRGELEMVEENGWKRRKNVK